MINDIRGSEIMDLKGHTLHNNISTSTKLLRVTGNGEAALVAKEVFALNSETHSQFWNLI